MFEYSPPLSSRLDPAELVAVVHAFARAGDGWRLQVQFDPTDRVSMLLYADERVDVYLSTWLPGQRSDLHDHGSSAVAFSVVSGRLNDRRASRAGLLARKRVRTGRPAWAPPGTVHELRNDSRHAAVSIHAYSPPLREVSFYRPERLAPPTRLRTVPLVPSLAWDAASRKVDRLPR